MFDYSNNKLLTPDGHICADYSRFSSPRSSLGEALSTDCEADVESNLSVLSGDLSGEGGNTRCRNSLTESDWSHSNTDSDKNAWRGLEWKEISTERKIAFFIALISVIFVLLGFILLSTYSAECTNDCAPSTVVAPVRKGQWATVLNQTIPITAPQFLDLDNDGQKEIIYIVSFCPYASCIFESIDGCLEPSQHAKHYPSNELIAVDSKSGLVVKSVTLPFAVIRSQCQVVNEWQVVCFCEGTRGNIAIVNLTNESIIYQKRPCNQILTCRLLQSDIRTPIMSVICTCIWKEGENAVYGLMLVRMEGRNIITKDALIESDLFPDNMIPKPRYLTVMNYGFQNDSYLVVTFQTEKDSCSLWLLPLISSFRELATMAVVPKKHLERLVSHVNCQISPLKLDVNNDGVMDLVSIGIDNSLLINDGITNQLDQLITQDPQDIISVHKVFYGDDSTLLLTRKSSEDVCPRHTLELFNPTGNMTSTKIQIPGLPHLMTASINAEGLSIFMWVKMPRSERCVSGELLGGNPIQQEFYETSQPRFVQYQSKKSVQHPKPGTPIDNTEDTRSFVELLRSDSSTENYNPSIDLEKALGYWQSLLQRNPPQTQTSSGITSENEPLPETIRQLCLQILRNLEELLERHLMISRSGAQLNGDMDNNFKILLRQFEDKGDIAFDRSFSHLADPDKQESETPLQEPYSDIYYIVISMILREVGHLKSSNINNMEKHPLDEITETRKRQDDQDHYHTPNEEIRYQNLYQTHRQLLSAGNRPDVSKGKGAAVETATTTQGLVATKGNDTSTRTKQEWCQFPYRLLHLVVRDGDYTMNDETERFMNLIPLEKAVSQQETTDDGSCRRNDELRIFNMAEVEDNLYVAASTTNENMCKGMILKFTSKEK